MPSSQYLPKALLSAEDTEIKETLPHPQDQNHVERAGQVTVSGGGPRMLHSGSQGRLPVEAARGGMEGAWSLPGGMGNTDFG